MAGLAIIQCFVCRLWTNALKASFKDGNVYCVECRPKDSEKIIGVVEEYE